MQIIVKAYGGQGGGLTHYSSSMKEAIKHFERIDRAYCPELFIEDDDGTVYKMFGWVETSL